MPTLQPGILTSSGLFLTRKHIVCGLEPVKYSHQPAHTNESAAGTAILSKVEPISVDYTLPGHPDPKSVKGRIVTLEFANLYLVGTYVVNAGTGLKVRSPFLLEFQKCSYGFNLLDIGRQETVERTLRSLHSGSRQEEACYMDW